MFGFRFFAEDGLFDEGSKIEAFKAFTRDSRREFVARPAPKLFGVVQQESLGDCPSVFLQGMGLKIVVTPLG